MFTRVPGVYHCTDRGGENDFKTPVPWGIKKKKRDSKLFYIFMGEINWADCVTIINFKSCEIFIRLKMPTA